MIAGISSINAAAASALSMLLRSDSSSLRRGAAGVQQRLPAQFGNKGIQLRAVEAIGAVVMEAIVNLMCFQPAAGFLMVSQFLIPYMVSIDKPLTFN